MASKPSLDYQRRLAPQQSFGPGSLGKKTSLIDQDATANLLQRQVSANVGGGLQAAGATNAAAGNQAAVDVSSRDQMTVGSSIEETKFANLAEVHRNV